MEGDFSVLPAERACMAAVDKGGAGGDSDEDDGDGDGDGDGASLIKNYY